MPVLAVELGRLMFGVVTSELLRGALQHSQHGIAGETLDTKGSKMSEYDLIGDDFDDDFGAIGADLIGDDPDLLDALAIEGDMDELISGAGDTELIGRRAGGHMNARKRALLQKLAMRGGGAVVRRGLNRRRRYPLGIVPTSVGAGASQEIPANPQNLFRPERLVIPSDISFDFGVRDIKVGNQSQLAQSAEVPAALFSEVAINTGVTFDTAEVGNQLSVDVRNKSVGALEFTAGVVGSLAK
jgi:hypothetical protein